MNGDGAAGAVPVTDARDLAPGELVRIFLGPAAAIMFQYRGGLADARGSVAAVLSAIDRQLLIADLMQALQRDGDGAL